MVKRFWTTPSRTVRRESRATLPGRASILHDRRAGRSEDTKPRPAGRRRSQEIAENGRVRRGRLRNANANTTRSTRSLNALLWPLPQSWRQTRESRIPRGGNARYPRVKKRIRFSRGHRARRSTVEGRPIFFFWSSRLRGCPSLSPTSPPLNTVAFQWRKLFAENSNRNLLLY